MALYISTEANRCLNCKKPLCMQGCPINTPIPQVISLFKENKIREAGQMLFQNNPMSLFCSIVCDHASQCEGHCILNKKEAPIRFSNIERYISDACLDRMDLPMAELNGIKVAVIGGGPAGISAAILLRQKGYEVTIFEAKNKIGGVLRYGIPDFRLPRSMMDRYEDKLLAMGIQIRTDATIGGALEIDDLFRDGYKAIFIGTGVWRPKKLGIQGESLSNVHFGIDYLLNPASHKLGKSLSILGMGNVAMDVARTAFRHGVEKVTLYARAKRVAASDHEVEYAKLDGAQFMFGMQVVSITEKGPVFKESIFDENDKVIGLNDELIQVESDSTIIAVSQMPKNKISQTTDGLVVTENGLLKVDEFFQSSKEGIFGAGDVVLGSNTVVRAAATAKKAVDAMDAYLQGRPLKPTEEAAS